MKKILLCVVIYNEKLWCCKIYNTFLNKLNINSSIYVYDNSPIAMHDSSEFKNSNIYYTSNPLNPGLSAAYNCAADFAAKHQYQWVMLLDQDTSIPISIIDEFNKTSIANPDINLFVPVVKIGECKYISPTRIRNHITKISKSAPRGRTDLSNYTCINSGLIINIDAFSKVGGYNEKVWLDFSDHEFINRFKRQFSTMYVLDTIIDQELSDFVNNPEQKLKRYEIYCNCIKNCQRFSYLDHLEYFYIVLKKAISLSIRLKTLKPFVVFYKNYYL